MKRESLEILLFLFCDIVFALHVRAVLCPSLSIRNGHVRMRQRGRFAKFTCNNGFILAGEKYSACLHGQWELPLPKCVRPTCAKMQTPPNAYIHTSHRGAVVHFSCKPEFTLHGATTSYCDGKKWDANPPFCQKSGTRPQYFCDFESENICGWVHDVNHDFDWRRFRYNTPSGHVGTGPGFDHTKGEGRDGYYMYIESSSRFENDTARLISPFYEKTENNTCFEFYYHMYGATMGTLRVYLMKTNEAWEFDPKKAFFEKTGHQGDHWYRSITNLGAIDQDFQIVIEGVRGSSYASDIAVDDVRVIENCAPETATTEDTTTDSSTLEVTFPTVESCENRCGLFAGATDQLYQIICDCDVDCVERNSCCLDYIAFCVLTGTDAATVTTTVSEDTETETTTVAATTATTKAKLILLTPPITERTIEKITQTITPLTTKKLPKTTRSSDEENEVIKIVRLATVAAIDVGEVPSVTDLTETIDKELEEHLLKPSNVITERIVKESTSSLSLVWVVVAVFAAIVVILIVALLVARRRSYFFVRGMQCTRGSGDSQSDVRFLTSDEVLDFRLAHPDEDSDL